MSGNEHIPMSYTELAVLLKDMARVVEEGDSFEGSVEYLIPQEEEHGVTCAIRISPAAECTCGKAEREDVLPDVMVRAVYRHGNSMGQGGVRIIGTQGGRP